MSQNSLVSANGTGAAVRAAINNAIDTLGTLNSGASSPSTTQAYFLWQDTTTGLLKIRNAANSAWVIIGRSASTGLGRVLNSTTSKSGTYTVVAADEGMLFKVSGTWTLALTAAATLGDGFTFAVQQTGAGVVTIDPNASELIDGVATLAMAIGDEAIVVCDGAGFITAARFQAAQVTLAGSQTLTNKTLTSPVIDTGITGTAVATQANQETATSTATIVTPGRQQFHPSAAKAWVNFNGTGTIAIRVSHNVTSVTDNSVGNYTINFTTSFSSGNYASTAMIGNNGGGGAGWAGNFDTVVAPTASALNILTGVQNSVPIDVSYVCVICCGDQ